MSDAAGSEHLLRTHVAATQEEAKCITLCFGHACL